ncbi:unnamed protein product, partial [marine sediment metagenome]
ISAADLTGTTRRSYSTDFHLIRVRCTGRVGIHLIMESFPAWCGWCSDNLLKGRRMRIWEW